MQCIQSHVVKTLFFLFISIQLFSQAGTTVTVESPVCFGGTFTFDYKETDGTGRYVYENALPLNVLIKYNPAMTRWEMIDNAGLGSLFAVSDMNDFSPNPPSSVATTWTETTDCGSSNVITVSGDGTQDMAGGDPCAMFNGDTDGDGVCNDFDQCPGFDDNLDMDNDNIPDGCDSDPMNPNGVIIDAPCLDPMGSFTCLLSGNDGTRNIYSNSIYQVEVAYNATAGQWEIRAQSPGTDVYFTNSFASLPDPPDNTTSPWVGTSVLGCDQPQQLNDVFGSETQDFLGCDLAVTDISTTDVACSGDMTGAITVTATSSNSITYSIDGPVMQNNSTGSFTGLPDGTYTLTVSDDAFPAGQCDSVNTMVVIDVTDNIPPMISCPTDIIMNVDAGQCGATVTYTAPVGTDNCPGATTMQTAGLGSGASFPVGVTTETYTVTDGAGLMATCSFTVTVIDNEPPVVSCPGDIMVDNDNGLCGAIVDFMASSTDNCPGVSHMVTSGPASGSLFPVGTTMVTITATDAAGLTDECTFSVTVNDTMPPDVVIQNITVQLDDTGNAAITAADVDGGSSDNCMPLNLAVSTDMFDCSHVGTPQTVMLTGDDGSNPPVSVSAMVTVEDNIPPLVTCQNISINLDENNMATITPADLITSVTEACGVMDSVLSMSMFDETHLGDNFVSLSVTDVNGNSAFCSATVTVGEFIPIPTLSQWGIIILSLLIFILGISSVKAYNNRSVHQS